MAAASWRVSLQAWVKVGLVEAGQLSSKKLPSVALELLVLRAYAVESAAAPVDLVVTAAARYDTVTWYNGQVALP